MQTDVSPPRVMSKNTIGLAETSAMFIELLDTVEGAARLIMSDDREDCQGMLLYDLESYNKTTAVECDVSIKSEQVLDTQS